MKNNPIFLRPAVLLYWGYILTNSCELIFCHNLVMLVPFCSYGDVLIEGGWGRENFGERSNAPRKPINSIKVNFNRFKGGFCDILNCFI